MNTNTSRRNVLTGTVATAAALVLPRTKAQAAKAVTHDVKIKAFAFVPDRLDVSVGDKVRWTNEDIAPHTATGNEFGWDTEEIVSGAQAEIVVTEAMEATYFCAFHPHMKGRLVIS